MKSIGNNPAESSCVSWCSLGSAGTEEATPVIGNVISLAGPPIGNRTDQTAQQSTQHTNTGVYELYVKYIRKKNVLCAHSINFQC